MDLRYFYNAVNESDDMKMWFGTIDAKLESLMNDLDQSVLESTEENNKSYNSDEGKAYEKQMKKLDKESLIRIRELLLGFEERYKYEETKGGRRLIKSQYINDRINLY